MRGQAPGGWSGTDQARGRRQETPRGGAGTQTRPQLVAVLQPGLGPRCPPCRGGVPRRHSFLFSSGLAPIHFPAGVAEPVSAGVGKADSTQCGRGRGRGMVLLHSASPSLPSLPATSTPLAPGPGGLHCAREECPQVAGTEWGVPQKGKVTILFCGGGYRATGSPPAKDRPLGTRRGREGGCLL